MRKQRNLEKFGEIGGSIIMDHKTLRTGWTLGLLCWQVLLGRKESSFINLYSLLSFCWSAANTTLSFTTSCPAHSVATIIQLQSPAYKSYIELKDHGFLSYTRSRSASRNKLPIRCDLGFQEEPRVVLRNSDTLGHGCVNQNGHRENSKQNNPGSVCLS